MLFPVRDIGVPFLWRRFVINQLDNEAYESLCSEFKALSKYAPLNAIGEPAARIRKFILTSHVLKAEPQLALGRCCASMLDSLLAMRSGIQRCSYGN